MQSNPLWAACRTNAGKKLPNAQMRTGSPDRNFASVLLFLICPSPSMIYFELLIR